MPDYGGLTQALLLGQRRRADPLEDFRKFGESLQTQGASVEPVRTPLQGLARALQGGLGGFFAGQADRQATARDQATVSGLATALGAKTPDELQAAIKGLSSGADADYAAPILGQLLSEKLADARKQQLGSQEYGALGGVIPGATSTAAAPGAPAPLMPQGGGVQTAALPAPGGFDNNMGNIRQSGAPFAGKGAPQNGFETFGTPQQGANAMAQNLQAYIQANPNITLSQAIAKWAPPNENNTNQYISQVAEGTGINPGAPLAGVMKDPVVAAQLLDAIARKEKGALPPGANADTFIAAAGGQPQMAQGSADGSPPQQQAVGAPPAVSAPPPAAPAFDPGADYEKLAQRAAASKDFERANAYQMAANKARTEGKTKDAEEASKRAADALEHDRRQGNTPPNAEQALSAGFADRMANSNGIFGQLPPDTATSLTGRALSKIPGGLGNYGQSPEYQKFTQARDDFINAQLRRESGAAIAPSEYTNADRQYFPQPGDGPEVIAQKEKNRALAVEGMKRNAGPRYAPSPGVGGGAGVQAANSKPTIVPVQTEQEYRALPPGTPYIAPDGSPRVKQ